ncbi:hypothetical protein GCM10007173_30950 [Glutamicibacter ardleyensis]|uniref:Hydantoinase/oxoprolinase N-terminal domain-containing protein n=1 Tax=Glutamicibacter ardleyensis TaxID=225894 RepID=A0ABQ2DRN4_9MICC|nr:hypothetical protein GCM10007173_30950 [Glutamicibacter ardleyensis]
MVRELRMLRILSIDAGGTRETCMQRGQSRVIHLQSFRGTGEFRISRCPDGGSRYLRGALPQ